MCMYVDVGGYLSNRSNLIKAVSKMSESELSIVTGSHVTPVIFQRKWRRGINRKVEWSSLTQWNLNFDSTLRKHIYASVKQISV